LIGVPHRNFYLFHFPRDSPKRWSAPHITLVQRHGFCKQFIRPRPALLFPSLVSSYPGQDSSEDNTLISVITLLFIDFLSFVLVVTIPAPPIHLRKLFLFVLLAEGPIQAFFPRRSSPPVASVAFRIRLPIFRLFPGLLLKPRTPPR